MGQLAAQVLALSGCYVTMLGKHEVKLVLAGQRGIKMRLIEEVGGTQSMAPGSRVDLVVECSGSAQGLELAMRLVRPRGTIVLKSTV